MPWGFTVPRTETPDRDDYKVFYPLTAFIGLLFLASFYYDLFLIPNPPDIGDKTVLLFAAAFQVLTIGLLADLIEKKSRL